MVSLLVLEPSLELATAEVAMGEHSWLGGATRLAALVLNKRHELGAYIYLMDLDHPTLPIPFKRPKEFIACSVVVRAEEA